MSKRKIKDFKEMAEEKAQSCEKSFHEIGDEYSYPEDHTAKQSEIIKNPDYHIKTLKKLYKLTNKYRFYQSRKPFIKHLLKGIRYYLFRETDYRYSLLFKHQEEYNQHLIELLEIMSKRINELENKNK